MRRNKLRVVAITLIVLPEPFTTVFGVILLVLSYILPKRHKESLRDLEDLVRRYRNYSKTTGTARAVRSKKPVVPQANTARDTVVKADNHIKVSSKIVHHTLRTSLQYEAVTDKPSKATVQPPPKDVFYSRLRPVSQAAQSSRQGNSKAKPHRASR